MNHMTRFRDDMRDRLLVVLKDNGITIDQPDENPIIPDLDTAIMEQISLALNEVDEAYTGCGDEYCDGIREGMSILRGEIGEI